MTKKILENRVNGECTCIETRDSIHNSVSQVSFPRRHILILDYYRLFIHSFSREREREREPRLYIYVHRTVTRELSKRGFCAIAFRFFRRMSIVPRKSSSGPVVAVFTETYGTVFFPPLPSKATFGFTETAINTVLSPRIARRKFRSRLSTFKKHNALFCFPSAFKTSAMGLQTLSSSFRTFCFNVSLVEK